MAKPEPRLAFYCISKGAVSIVSFFSAIFFGLIMG